MLLSRHGCSSELRCEPHCIKLNPVRNFLPNEMSTSQGIGNALLDAIGARRKIHRVLFKGFGLR